MKYSEASDEQRTGKVDYIDKRWKQLHELEVKRWETLQNYLFLVSGGASAATLTYLGNLAKDTVDAAAGIYWMLGLFVGSLLLVGILKMVLVYDALVIFKGWREIVSQFYEDKIEWEYAVQHDERKAARLDPSIAVVTIFAYLLLVVGAGIGVYQFITGGQHGRSKEAATNTSAVQTTFSAKAADASKGRGIEVGPGREDRNITSKSATGATTSKEVGKENSDADKK